MKILLRVVGAALALLLTEFVYAQTNWPTKPIRVLVPYSAGGATDIYPVNPRSSIGKHRI